MTSIFQYNKNFNVLSEEYNDIIIILYKFRRLKVSLATIIFSFSSYNT